MCVFVRVCVFVCVSSLCRLLCVAVSLDSILQDVRALQRGMEVTRRELEANSDPVLQTFLSRNTELLNSVAADGKTAQVAFSHPKYNFNHMSRSVFIHQIFSDTEDNSFMFPALSDILFGS